MEMLTGKYAVVTGAARGIGAAVIKRFLAEGVAGVAMLDINGEDVKAKAKMLDPEGKRTLPLACDVANSEMVHTVFEKILAEFGRIDIMVNNAGITRDSIFHKMTEAQFKTVVDVNLCGVFNCLHEVVPLMRNQEYGRIVNVASTSVDGVPGQANYAASKMGIIGLTRTIAREVARKGVTANVVAPGLVETEIIQTMPKELIDQWVAKSPMLRMGQPEEIAAAITFLSSDDSSYINGTSLLCTGGAKTAI